MISLILIIIIIWIWYMHMTKPVCDEILYDTIFSDSGKYLKTGDLILFKSLNNLNSIFMCNYYTHVGMVVIDPILTNNKPYLFEASGTADMKWKGIEFKAKKGIFLFPLEDRIRRYLGYVYIKPLSHPITDNMHYKLINFIFYAMNNMSYNYNILGNCFRKKLLKEKCGNRTNCAETTFLSLINMGLLNKKLWYNPLFHYLKWICNLKKLDKSYKYNDIIEITTSGLIS